MKKKSKAAPKKTPKVLAPKVTFVGGKWYNEYGKQVPKPQPPAPAPAPATEQPQELQRYVPPQPYLRPDEKRIDGCTCAQPSLTGHVPGCVHYIDSVYNCEASSPEDLQRFSALRGTPLAEMQFNRLTQQAFPVTLDPAAATREMDRRKRVCATDLIQTDVPRRRCWMCPVWDRHQTVTPFDSQKRSPSMEALEKFPEALEDDDDELPF